MEEFEVNFAEKLKLSMANPAEQQSVENQDRSTELNDTLPQFLETRTFMKNTTSDFSLTVNGP